jgi:diguanylate cyclase (GGDEF)-like protein
MDNKESITIKIWRCLFLKLGSAGVILWCTVFTVTTSAAVTGAVIAFHDFSPLHPGTAIAISAAMPLLITPLVAGQFTYLIEHLMRLEVQLVDQTMRDPLTGLPNRRWIMRRYQQLIHAGSGRLTALMLDIDRFKSINDRYGHSSGDLVLNAIAQTLTAQFGSNDCAGRYGGEEFLVLIACQEEAEGFAIAETLRRAIAGLTLPEVDANLIITVSIGIATHALPFDAATQHDNSYATIHDVLRRADQALYNAKALGRNRVERAPA